jgi:hypothetical protein
MYIIMHIVKYRYRLPSAPSLLPPQGRDPEDPNQLMHLDDNPVYEVYRVRLPVNRCGPCNTQQIFFLSHFDDTVLWAWRYEAKTAY